MRKEHNKNIPKLSDQPEGYLYSMSRAHFGESHWAELIPAIIFSAIVILIVRMHTYERPMGQFYWSNGNTELTDFFSYYKMVFIVICAVLALLTILYKILTQTLTIKRSFAYIPIGIYSFFVLISYLGSEHKEFALWGWNDRFEGTIPLLCYMILLFYTINVVNSEKNVKWIIYPLALSSALLGLLGISQALGHDFFRTNFGKMLITPTWFWSKLNGLNFTFKNNEIYQTVYNINYVSFYLTLLIPLFGMLFIYSMNKGKEEAIWKKIAWGLLFALLIFNLIGSASSGGFLGLSVIGLLGIILLNKRILNWWKPITLLLIITIIVSGLTYERWMPELSKTFKGITSSSSSLQEQMTDKNVEVEPGSVKPYIDFIQTNQNNIIISINGNPLTVQVTADASGSIDGLILLDDKENVVPMYLSPNNETTFIIDDKRFKDYATLSYAKVDDIFYILIDTAGRRWPFAIQKNQILYRIGSGNFISLEKVPAIGFKNNQSFGSGRGYIWSRTLPIMKDTLFLGKGADTYCIYFPQNDYAGKYNSPNFSNKINIVVDKPHNMYMGMSVGTGLLSMISLLALWILYIIQSVIIYFKREYDNDFLSFCGFGIFLGICGFLASGLVNDSTVSVMPMFYGLLGTGISINTIIKNMRL